MDNRIFSSGGVKGFAKGRKEQSQTLSSHTHGSIHNSGDTHTRLDMSLQNLSTKMVSGGWRDGSTVKSV